MSEQDDVASVVEQLYAALTKLGVDSGQIAWLMGQDGRPTLLRIAKSIKAKGLLSVAEVCFRLKAAGWNIMRYGLGEVRFTEADLVEPVRNLDMTRTINIIGFDGELTAEQIVAMLKAQSARLLTLGQIMLWLAENEPELPYGCFVVFLYDGYALSVRKMGEARTICLHGPRSRWSASCHEPVILAG